MSQVPPNYFVEKEEDSIDLKSAVMDYLRYWPWFVAGLVLCLMGSYLYNRYTPKTYQTSAKIKILDENSGIDLPTADMLFNKSNVNLENEVEIIHSYPILKEVVEELGLNTVVHEEGNIQISQQDTLPFSYQMLRPLDSIRMGSTQFKIRVKEEGFEVIDTDKETTTLFPGHDSSLKEHDLPFQIKVAQQGQLSKSMGKQYNIELIATKEAVLQLKKALMVDVVGKSSDILQLSIEGESPSRSERILNAVVRAFNNDGIQDRQLISKRTLDFIDDRFLFLAQELDSIEVDKKDFKQDNNLIYLEADSQISLEKRTKADEELFRIENQLALSQLLEEALSGSKNQSSLLPANIGLENNVVNNLIAEYNKAILDRNKLVSSGGEQNPLVQQLLATLKGLRENIDNSINAYKRQLQVSKQGLSTRDARFRSEVYQLPEKEKLLRAINRQQQIKESLYLLLLQKREEAAISLAVTEPSVKVVEYALSETKPIAPKTKIVYLFGLVLGLFIPFGVLYLRYILDTKVHGEKDFSEVTALVPVLGEIPDIKDDKNLVFSDPNDRSMLAESFRILSSNVKFMLPPATNARGAVILCTSSAKGEGKTFGSLNLSLALSSLNKRVLLIGADLRNPQLHTYINQPKSTPGLSNYLYDPSFDWRNALIAGFEQHPQHRSLISGEIPPNPPHLLSNGRMELLLEEARGLFDYIVVDTAPTMAITDTLLIADLADATLYFTRANYTEKGVLPYAAALAKQQKIKNMAFVVNSVGNSRKGANRYGYGYSYGYQYDQDEKG